MKPSTPNEAMQAIDRRTFIETAAAGTLALAGGIHAAEAPRNIQLGLIGCGWYGMVDVEAAFRVGGVAVAALCDVDRDHLEESAKKVEKLQGSRPKTFTHYEELLETPGLEAVIIATPPQWHALQFLAALKKGLHVYAEKPLAYDVRECQAMAAAAAQSDRIVQVGFQRRQSPAFQQVKKYLDEGRAGRVVQVDVQIHYTAGTKDAKPQEPPAALDWDLWCGPAPKLPYSPQIGHMSWRLEKAYGHGHLVDWGIHLIDATRVILGEKMPLAVQAAGGIYRFKDIITTPDIFTAHFEFEKCPVVWRHRIWGAEEFSPETANGIFFYGDKETVFATDDRWVTIPRGKGQERVTHTASADMGQAHMANFLKCLRTRQAPVCTVADALQSTTAVKLAMIAYETGRRIEFDPATMTIRDSREANALLRREYRAPWRHPFAG